LPPFEAGDGKRYGDGLEEIRRLGLNNRHEAIFVAATFSHLPRLRLNRGVRSPADGLARQVR